MFGKRKEETSQNGQDERNGQNGQTQAQAQQQEQEQLREQRYESRPPRYEYRVEGCSPLRRKGPSMADVIQGMAEKGWRLVETIDVNGTTNEAVFEREIEKKSR